MRKYSLEVEGLQELEQKLLAIDDAVKSKTALRGAMMFASLPMMKSAKSNVPYQDPDTNDVHIRDSIGRQTTFPKNGPTIELRLGEKKKKITDKNGKKRSLVYGHLLEFRGFPWLRPAFDANVRTFLARFSKKLATNIEKAAK